MQNEYEESFYYDKSGSTGDAVAGEVIGAGIGLGVGGISMILAAVIFFVLQILPVKLRLVSCSVLCNNLSTGMGQLWFIFVVLQALYLYP